MTEIDPLKELTTLYLEWINNHDLFNRHDRPRIAREFAQIAIGYFLHGEATQ